MQQYHAAAQSAIDSLRRMNAEWAHLSNLSYMPSASDEIIERQLDLLNKVESLIRQANRDGKLIEEDLDFPVLDSSVPEPWQRFTDARVQKLGSILKRLGHEMDISLLKR